MLHVYRFVYTFTDINVNTFKSSYTPTHTRIPNTYLPIVLYIFANPITRILNTDLQNHVHVHKPDYIDGLRLTYLNSCATMMAP